MWIIIDSKTKEYSEICYKFLELYTWETSFRWLMILLGNSKNRKKELNRMKYNQLVVFVHYYGMLNGLQ